MRVRRFRCKSPQCRIKLFCERLGEFAASSARRTWRMNQSLTALTRAEGGRPGSRLAETLGMHTDRMTLLRLVRAAPEPAVTTPTVLGVDDFALRRGRNYGTILYDLERHVVIDLLPDRSAQSLTTWLLAHPGVVIISRDRAEGYAAGARDGDPDAQQVADRWHLLSNLGDALESFLQQNQATLRVVACEDNETVVAEETASAPAQIQIGPVATTEKTDTVAPAVPISVIRAQEQAAHHRVARQARYDEVRRLHEAGHTNKAIALHLGMGQSTVRKFLRAEVFPERAERAWVAGKLSPFHRLLQVRWDAGNRDMKLLLAELKALGYTGGLSRLYAYVQVLRQKSKPQCRLKSGAGKFSPRQVASLLLTPKRTPEQQAFLDRLTAGSALFATARGLAEGFCTLIHKRPQEDAPVPLGLWLEEALSSCIAPLASFARGVRDDWEAVVAGMSLPWSQGPVEGAVNRIKMIKRQMFGRANFDLLRRRVLPAS